MSDQFGLNLNCPHCAEPFALTSSSLGEQVLTLRLEWEGELMQARTIAGTIDGTRRLLEASAKEMGAVAQVFVRNIRQADRRLEVDFLVMTKAKRGKKGNAEAKGAEG